MSRDYDIQVIESYAVRRARLRECLLWGRERRQRAVGDLVRWFGISLVLAAVGCAGCVGWTYLRTALHQAQHGSVITPYPTGPTIPTAPPPSEPGQSRPHGARR